MRPTEHYPHAVTPEIATVLAIVVAAVVLFASERVRADVVGLLVLVALAVTGLVSAEQALSGFASPAVITIWAMFMLSAGLVRTGVAGVVGRLALRFAGEREPRLVGVVMLSEGAISAFMNNVGATALLLPVVMDLARRTRRASSRLLLPLAAASLLGGLVTQIGTPPNIVVSSFMREAGLEHPFGVFSYAPTGIAALLAGVAFVVVAGRRLLPDRPKVTTGAALTAGDLGALYDLGGRMDVLRLPSGSPLAGMTLADSRLGAALGLNVIAIARGDRLELAPPPDSRLADGDRLVVEGRLDNLDALHGPSRFLVEGTREEVRSMLGGDLAVATMQLAPGSPLVGETLRDCRFRQRHDVNVLGIARDGAPLAGDLRDVRLAAGDLFVVQGDGQHLEALAGSGDFTHFEPVPFGGPAGHSHEDRLLALGVPEGSPLAGNSLAESRLGDAYNLTVLAIVRGGRTMASPGAAELLRAGDRLLVKGHEHDLRLLSALEGLAIDEEPLPDLEALETEQIALAEVVLSPHTRVTGRSLRDIHFRERYGLNVLAIWREGHAVRSNLRDMPLRLGDALLVHGSRDRLRLLGSDPDYLVLTQGAQEAPRTERALAAGLIMLAVIGASIAGVLPIAIASVIGATAMVLTGCLTMEEAYHHVEWPAVFLVASMLPLGIAMQETGAAEYIAGLLIALVGGLGATAVLAAIFLLGASAVQFIPNSAVAVLVAPIALDVAGTLSISPYPLLMAVAMSASAGFASPTGHAVNMMVMGPGGYRFRDYVRFGLPLLAVLFLVVILFVPLVFPLAP